MTPPVVSVIVPVYNGKRTIKLCLDALLSQDYPRSQYEIIAVDNASKDNSLQIISNYPEVRLFQETTVQGSYAARNRGIAQAQGEIVAFIDADCVAQPSWLSELVSGFANPGILAVGGQLKAAEPTNMIEQFLAEVSNFHGDYQQTGAQLFPPLLTGNAAFRKHVVEELGGFDASLFTGGDVDLAWRMQHLYGACTCFKPDAVVFHHHYYTLTGMYRQYRRHGVGEIYIDALYHRYPGYPRSLRYQMIRISSQLWALLTYLRSFVYRLVKYPFRRDKYYTVKPLLLFVCEWANLVGKFNGLRQTRFLQRSPGNATLRTW